MQPGSEDMRECVRLLQAQDAELRELYRRADAVRRQTAGDAVFLRGIIEFSNFCQNDCLYCGIRRSNRKIRRYVMSAAEIMTAIRALAGQRYTTVVLQAGESQAISDEELGRLIRRIKQETPLAVTLSVGNRPRAVYEYWRDCGMDRCLIRFETSDPALFRKLHPDCSWEERIECLRVLRDLGVQTGGGFMIGLPGETVETLAANLLLCRELDLDMIGLGPFIPHPDTPLGLERNIWADEPEMFFKAVAVLRIFNPDAHIPATTAFDAMFPGTGRDLALQRGANVFMPNCTPTDYRKDYLLYPGKPCLTEAPDHCTQCVVARIEAMDRKIGVGPGHSLKKRRG